MVKHGRYAPCKKLQHKLLYEQNYCCNACGCDLKTGSYEFDHIIPYSWSQNNSDDNWQILCLRCNRLASNFVFDLLDIEKAKVKKNRYIVQQILKKSR